MINFFFKKKLCFSSSNNNNVKIKSKTCSRLVRVSSTTDLDVPALRDEAHRGEGPVPRHPHGDGDGAAVGLGGHRLRGQRAAEDARAEGHGSTSSGGVVVAAPVRVGEDGAGSRRPRRRCCCGRRHSIVR